MVQPPPSKPGTTPVAPVPGGTSVIDFTAAAAAGGATSGLTLNTGDGNIKTLEAVIKEIDIIAANNPREYANVEKLAEAAGFTSIDAALKFASLDESKDSQSWDQYLAKRAKNPYVQKMVSESGSGGYSSSTNTSVRLSSASEAGTLADRNFESLLGRTATNDEARAFQKALNEQEKKNPSVTKTSGYSSGSGSSTSTSTTQAGFDPTRFGREYAMSQEGYAERFAGMTFMNILDKAIAEPNAIDDLIASGNG
jgi:hypothetical protein